jgi:Immune inhibitor A-like, MAM domain
MRAIVLLAVAAVVVLAPQARSGGTATPPVELRVVEPSAEQLTSLELAPLPRAKIAREARRETVRAAVIGDRRLWPALDSVKNVQYLKYYTLRALGTNIEVWVASDQDAISKNLEYPAGDCRNDDRVDLSDVQAQYLAQQFDSVMYPRESPVFSTPPPRDGTRANIPARSGLPAGYYAGDGGRVVALVDNIRDENFNDVEVRSGIGGFYTPIFNDDVDRNVITVDGIDWVHRTGATPPDNPIQGDLCRSRSARPYLIEATFAHEYQHLLQEYHDDREVSWINEGLSMYAEQVTGYTDVNKPVTNVGFSGSVQCFLGNAWTVTPANPNPTNGGPENSLTTWGDKGDSAIVCDYGAAETFMHYLAGRFGVGFITQLHRDPDHGLASVRKLLAANRADVMEVIHDWAAMIALDGVLDRGYSLGGGQAGKYRTGTLTGGVDWRNPQDFEKVGAPPNGSDYLRLRKKNGAFFKAAEIRSISFDGSKAFPVRPIEWSVDRSPPDHGGNAALYSGSGGVLDRGIVRQVKVPSGPATLTFQTRYDLAAGLDFGFVQVSANGGRSWKSLASPLTSNGASPNASSLVRRNLPGLTGRSGQGSFPAWVRASYDLGAYRGKTVLLAFRFASDARVTFPGWWIDDIRLGGATLSAGRSLAGWKSFSQFSPGERVGGFTVQLVGYTTNAKRAFIHRLRLDGRLRAELKGAALRRVLAGGYDVVAALVTYDEPTEGRREYAPYLLRVNGILQPGG